MLFNTVQFGVKTHTHSQKETRFSKGLGTTVRVVACYIHLHTCVINVVLNAMVKVNQAAILLVSPGQPRHQPTKQQNLFIP